MTTITIPKNLVRKDDLVIVPRKEYEELLHAREVKEFYAELDKDLDRAIASHRRGESTGPFTSVAQLKKSLKK